MACLALCHCALDDRSPVEAMGSNQPAAGSAAMPPAGPLAPGNMGVGGNAGSGGSAPVSSAGAGSSSEASGMGPGAGGMANGGGSGAGGASGMAPAGVNGGPGPVDLSGAGAPALSNGSCPAFTPCGGELDGSWLYSEVCPTTNLGELQSVCPSATVEYEPGGAAALSFGNGQLARSGAPVGAGVVTFPAECGLGACTIVAAVVGDRAECSEVAGDCACRTPFSVDWGQQAYTSSGTQLSLADGRTFDYCVDGDRLTYRESGSATEPGVFTLQRNGS